MSLELFPVQVDRPVQRDADDPFLTDRARRGDSDAFETLVRHYSPRLFQTAYRLLGNQADAEDALQQALVKAYLHLGNFRGDAAFGTWLHRIVINLCHDELRRRSRRIRSETEWEPDRTPVPDQTSESRPDEAAEQEELGRTVQVALEAIPPVYRTPVVLRDLHDYSYDEIATTLGCSVGTVKSRVHRGRQALRLILNRVGFAS